MAIGLSQSLSKSDVQIGVLLDQVDRLFRATGLAESRLKAELILSHALGCLRLELWMRGQETCTAELRNRVEEWVDRACRHEPIQYVLGEVDFRGLRMRVDRRALIPRPETELLVQRVLDCREVWSSAHPAVVDVGTGSGCIALVLAQAHPQAQITAVDVDPAALALARENARQVFADANSIRWVENDLLSGFAPGSVDVIVSNPPYISTRHCDTLSEEIRRFEPRRALDGGPDGIRVIAELVKQAARVLKPGGWIFMEVGDDQGERVSRLLIEAGFVKVKIGKDLAARDRLAEGQIP